MLRPAMGGTIHSGRSRRAPGARSARSLDGSITVPTPAGAGRGGVGLADSEVGRVGRRRERACRAPAAVSCTPTATLRAARRCPSQQPALVPPTPALAPPPAARVHLCSRERGGRARMSPLQGWPPRCNSLCCWPPWLLLLLLLPLLLPLSCAAASTGAAKKACCCCCAASVLLLLPLLLPWVCRPAACLAACLPLRCATLCYWSAVAAPRCSCTSPSRCSICCSLKRSSQSSTHCWGAGGREGGREGVQESGRRVEPGEWM